MTVVDIKPQFVSFIKELQQEIVFALEQIDGGKFRRDEWEREGDGGHGITCVIQDSNVLEKAGVNISIVHGACNSGMIHAMKSRNKPVDPSIETRFYAAGISLVIHPHNPMAPTVHMNTRYFELHQDGAVVDWWFGGGSDLTPSYLFEQDAVHFHQTLKDACDRHDQSFYPKFKDWCDKYFDIPHRKERRGIGGIFFDDLNGLAVERLFAFVADAGKALVPAYIPILRERSKMPYTPANKEWQQLRRGRYVEFNLCYDRGTKFGLASAGRTESILMSLPLTARWEYCQSPPDGSAEQTLLSILQTPRNWLCS